MAKWLNTKLEFDLNLQIIDTICDRKKNLPEQVFRQAKEHFLFLLFDEMYLPSFFADIKEFLRDENENEFRLAVLDPDPETYFFENFGTYHLASFSGTDSVEDYIALLSQDPGGSSADAVIFNSNVVLLFSTNRQWAIYADRQWEIAICWFANEETIKKFRHVYNGVVIDTVESTLEFIKETFGVRNMPIEFEITFKKNYSGLEISKPGSSLAK